MLQVSYQCSTMGVGCQSRRFNCLFWRETRQRILGHEISPYPEVVRGRERELTTRPRERQLVAGAQERQLVVGQERGELVAGEQRAVGGRRPREAVGGWKAERRQLRLDKREARTRERQLVAGAQERQLVAGAQERELVAGRAEGSWDWTRERRTERLAWIHGGAVNTRHQNREARRQDRVQWRRVSRCLIPVALWNFR